MPLRIRQPKQQQPEKQHARYVPNTGKKWTETERERNGKGTKLAFYGIIGAAVVIVVLLILIAIRAALPSNDASTTTINAADTYAITQKEQEELATDTKTFAQQILIYAYCGDSSIALQAKNAALSMIASNSEAYTAIEGLQQSAKMDKEDLLPVVTEPKLMTTTQVYASQFTYTCSGVVANGNDTDENNPNGKFVDSGYDFTVTFRMAIDENGGDSEWKIASVKISKKY